MTTQLPRRGLLLGLLSMFGATPIAGLPSFSIGIASSRHRAPAHVQEWYRRRAEAKRARRAANPHASNYARANVR
jgi:hypothetical protein